MRKLLCHYCTVLYCTLLYCTVLYCTVIYCTVLYCNVRCKYIGNHSRNDYFGFITVNFLEINNRGDRGGWGEKLEYLSTDKHTINQVKSNSKTEATLSTVVCGSSGSGPIGHYYDGDSRIKQNEQEFPSVCWDRNKVKL